MWPYRQNIPGVVPPRIVTAPHFQWLYKAGIKIITDTFKNLGGLYIIAIRFAHEAISTKAGTRIIRIPSAIYSTLNQHLQDGRTVAANDANRQKIRPRRPPIRHNDVPVAPPRLITDLFQRIKLSPVLLMSMAPTSHPLSSREAPFIYRRIQRPAASRSF
jgi:hypothetical protein